MGCLVVIIGLWICVWLWSIHPILGLFGLWFLIKTLND